MKSKRVKQMICSVDQYLSGCKYKEMGFVWMSDDKSPCMISWATANFIWIKHDSPISIKGKV